MPSKSLSILNGLLLALSAATANGQTWTSCNPLNSTCPSDQALSTNHTFDFTTTQPGDTWNTTAGTVNYNSSGGQFTINQKGDAPTIQSKFYLFFGQVEVWMKAAHGQGVVSSVVLQSDDLDEIDWEIIGSNTTHAENNYYGKGNTTDAISRAKWMPMASPPQDDFHNYTTQWTKDQLDWYIDGNIVRTLKYEDANGGASYPQTPMNLRIGIWAAGDPSNNKYTVDWAGGAIDYSKGPYTMSIKSARVTDFSSGKEYKYGDNSGTYQSIQVVQGNSSTEATLNKPPPESLKQRWSGLSTAAKIGIAAGTLGAIALLFLAFLTYCIRQRRAGARERIIADAQYEKDTAELLEYRTRGVKGGWERL